MNTFNLSVKDLCEECFQIHSNTTPVVTRNLLFNNLLVKLCDKFVIGSKEINKAEILNFVRRFSECWIKSYRSTRTFLKNYRNTNWYLSSICLIKRVNAPVASQCEKNVNCPKKRGRPNKQYLNSAQSSKRRKVYTLAEDVSIEQAFEVLKHQLRKHNEFDKVSVLESLQYNDSESVAKFKEAIAKPVVTYKDFSTSEALALYVDLDLSYRQYKIMRSAFIKKSYKGLPSCEKLVEEKNACIPKDMSVDDISAKLPLQSCLDHTAKRILETLDVDNHDMKYSSRMTLDFKWGCDGSSGQSQYKQKIDQYHSDSHMFMVSVVPLRLSEEMTNTSNEPQEYKEVWKNDRPSSVQYCRPVEFSYSKETKEVILEKYTFICEQIKKLTETVYITKHGSEIKIKHNLIFTMIDGKVAQAISGNKSSMSCTVCHANQKDFNKPVETSRYNEIEKMYELGLSPLHARIRFMEHCLKIGYDMEFQIYKKNTPDFEKKPFKEKQKIKNQFRADAKKQIQEKFKENTGLRIDCPKQGFGNTNDGNTARRFFDNVEVTASITKIDQQLLNRFRKLLSAINCRENIDAQKFGKYASETLELYNDLYGSWRSLSPTIHKVLCHGENIIKYHTFPIGELSEEAQEAKNKEYKEFRLRHTRKCSRKDQNADLMKMLMVSSDPLITSLRYRVKKNSENEVLSDLEDLVL